MKLEKKLRKKENKRKAQLEAIADSTWGTDNVYALLLTFAGASVLHTCKKMHLIVDSSTELVGGDRDGQGAVTGVGDGGEGGRHGSGAGGKRGPR